MAQCCGLCLQFHSVAAAENGKIRHDDASLGKTSLGEREREGRRERGERERERLQPFFRFVHSLTTSTRVIATAAAEATTTFIQQLRHLEPLGS